MGLKPRYLTSTIFAKNRDREFTFKPHFYHYMSYCERFHRLFWGEEKKSFCFFNCLEEKGEYEVGKVLKNSSFLTEGEEKTLISFHSLFFYSLLSRG